jgi:succinoglycan biosynthesis transport protein ExoP
MTGEMTAEPQHSAKGETPPAPPPGGVKINPVRSLRRHRSPALAVMFLIAAAGLPVAWMKGTAKYSATAVIYVSPRFVANLQDGKEQDIQSQSQYQQYLYQSARTINRFDIVLSALRKTNAFRNAWLRPGEKIEHGAERLQGALDIKPVENTYQIAVTLETGKAVGLADLLNNVVDTYLAAARNEEFFASDQRIKTLADDRSRLQQEVDQKKMRRLEIGQELGISSFSDNFVNPYDRLLVEAKEAGAAAARARIEADAQLGAFDDKQRTGGAGALRAAASADAGKDSAMSTMNEKLNIRRAQLLAAMSGLSPDHPGRRAAERELAEIEREREDTYRKLVDSFSVNLLAQKRAEAYKAARVEQKLNSELEKQISQASWFARNYQEGIQIGAEVESARKQMESLQQRIDFLSLEKSAPGFARLFSSARPPSEPSGGGRKKLFLMVLGAALAMGLAAPVGVDLLDPRLQSPGDVGRILGFAPLAWLMEKSEAGPEFSREQAMRLANRIAQEQEATNSRIFAFTSVKARGGTSTIVMETALALGRLGIPALAVEANAYRADPRYRAPNSRGLTVVLRGNEKVADAVVHGGDEMPDYVPVGDMANEKNLPDIQNLTRILRDSAESYRAILVDLPPILVSVDAEFIARTSDVVVLVIEAEKVSKEELTRAAASLARLNVPAVSAVLNRVRLNTRDGLAESALKEFRHGSEPLRGGKFRRWLWK